MFISHSKVYIDIMCIPFQVPSAKYLEKLERYNFNAFEPKLQLRSWRLPLDIWSAYRNQTI